jgi:hypothetical protein
MGRTSVLLNVNKNNSLSVASIPSRGSDWGESTMQPNESIQAGSNSVLVGSIGEPGYTETNHWGWLYFTVANVNGGLSFPMQIYIHVTHTAVDKVLVGPFDSGSSESNPMPGGTFGNVEVKSNPPDGQVVISI